MEVSPKTLREVEFREKMRGYHPEDVDHFLEQVATGIEALQERLRQALDRAQRAESAAAEAGGADDALRKTLVLAQRTADMAVQEAREQASRVLASAEQQAQSIIAEAEERGRRTLEETIAEAKAELSRLEASRVNAHQQVDSLQRWIEEHKTHLTSSLSEALAAVERVGVMWTPPPSSEGSGYRETAHESHGGAIGELDFRSGGASDRGDHGDQGPETVMWSPGDEMGNGGGDLRSAQGSGLDDDAIDNFFDDSGALGGETRIGGRLRRRR